MQAKITHALPDVRELRTSGNGCYQSPPFLRPRDQKKRRLWGREWFEAKTFKLFRDRTRMRDRDSAPLKMASTVTEISVAVLSWLVKLPNSIC